MDTTSHLVTLVTYYLSQNKECLRILTQEIDENIKSDKDLSGDNFKKMTYLDGVIRET